MLFPEDGCLPRITRSGLSPFNNVMIIKVPEQFRKPGETIFQLATLDPSKKTERWPADKFIYKNSVAEEVTVPNSSESSTKEKRPEKSKFEIKVLNSFALEKQRLKEKLSNSDHDKKVSPNIKNFENHQDFKNQTARNHQDDRKSFIAKSKNRDYNDAKSHDVRKNNRAQHIDPWINPPYEFINSVYDESVNINELKNPTVDLMRQQSEASHFYNGGERRMFSHMPGAHLNERLPVKNRPEAPHPGYMVYQEPPSWQRSQETKRGLLTTPPKKLFNCHPQGNPSDSGYFEPNRNIPEKLDFGAIPRRDRHLEDPLDFNISYGNHFQNISGHEPEFLNDRNYTRSNRDEPNFHRNQSNEPFSNNLNEIDSYRNAGFLRPYPIPGNGFEYQGRRYEQKSSKADFRNPEGKGRGRDFRPRNQNNRRDYKGRTPFRSSRGHRYARGQRNKE